MRSQVFSVVCACVLWLETLVLAILLFTSDALKKGVGRIPVYIMTTNYTANEYVMKHDGVFDVPVAITVFLLVSAVVQCLRPSIEVRFLEYSVSAPLMLMCIALEVGIRDVYTISLLGIMMSATNLLGMVTELLLLEHLAWAAFPHMVGWLLMLGSYVVVFVAFSVVPGTPPDFVYAIVALMFLLFCLFGFVQIYDLVVRHNYLSQKEYEKHVDRIGTMYDVLSLVAKSLLAWLVVAPLLQGMSF